MYRAALFSLVVFVCWSWPCRFDVLAAQEKKKDPLDETIAGKTVGEWIKILRTHENPKFRRAALIALEAGDAAGRTALPALLNAIEKDKDAQVRQEAVMLLGRLGPKTNGALKALMEALQTDKADEVREAAATAIASEKFTEASVAYVSVLANAMKDPHAGTRVAVAGALRNLGENARPAFGVLIESARNPKEHVLVREAAVHVVSRYGKDNAQTVPLLLDLLKGGDSPTVLREAAADGLGRSGSDAAEIIAALAQALEDKSIELRKAAAVALGTLSLNAKSAWPAVKERLAYKTAKDRLVPVEPDSGVRNTLTRLTGTLAKSTPEAIPVLASVAKNDESTETRIAAIQELGELGSVPKEARDTLRVIAAQDARAAVREAAAKALKQLGG
jgi:HEAT repeat protein